MKRSLQRAVALKTNRGLILSMYLITVVTEITLLKFGLIGVYQLQTSRLKISHLTIKQTRETLSQSMLK